MQTRRLLLSALLAGAALPALARSYVAEYPGWDNASYVLQAGLVEVSVLNYDNGMEFPIFLGREQAHVAGAQGQAYRIKIRNKTGGRLLVVPSVDGINVLTGKTASPRQSGYLVPAHGEVTIDGWRKSMDEIAKFVFSSPAGSYAARTGRAANVGVIGIAVFEEMRQPRRWDNRAVPHSRHSSGESLGGIAGSAPVPGHQSGPSSSAMQDAPVQKAQRMESMTAQPSLGTGHGERDVSRATQVDFQRATLDPVEVVRLDYDSAKNLETRGIAVRRVAPKPQPRRDPFPADGFVPDPTMR